MQGEEDLIEVKSSKSFNSKKAVDSITQKDIQMLKMFARPPEVVKTILEYTFKVQAGYNPSVVVNSKGNFDYPPEEIWKYCGLAMKGDRCLVKVCADTFDYVGKDPALDRHIREVGKKMVESGLNIDKVKQASQACASLAAWLLEIIEYEAALNAPKA